MHVDVCVTVCYASYVLWSCRALMLVCDVFFFFQAEDGIRDLVRSRGLGDVYKRQQQQGLVVAALADPPFVQRHGYDHIDRPRYAPPGLLSLIHI